MTHRTVFHVVPAAKDDVQRWVIKRDGKPVVYVHLQSTAVRDARALAKRHRPSQVVVHGRSGRILHEWTYGADPERFPG